MAMLTREEVADQLNSSASVKPEKFFKELADFMPQQVMEDWMDEMREYFTEKVGEEGGNMLTTAYMMGFHSGWYLARRVIG